ncbi:MAG: RNA methyltransferase [Flavobacteriaceae bacterium]|nr:RNA methyltransferase [Flavobacteriaceae bacterium]
MVSKSEIKLISSLQQKKYRNQSGLFVAEGRKVIAELLNEGMDIKAFYTTQADEVKDKNHHLVSERELQKMSSLKTANGSLAIFHIPSKVTISRKGITVVLDSIRDPGNLGTIIRLCDWFSANLVCSEDTVDCYNSKVVQATMGSIARVPLLYQDLKEFLEVESRPILGARMDGDNVYQKQLPAEAVLILGNEANGISESISQYITKAIAIPQFGISQKTESLNVATAGAILLSELRRSTEM